eukprot:g2934.t1
MSVVGGHGVGPGGRYRPTHSQRQVALYHEQQLGADPIGELRVPVIESDRPFELWLRNLLHDIKNNNPAVTRVAVTAHGDASAAAIAGALRTNTTVIEWDLRDSQISDAGARAVAAAMQPTFNRSVKKLILISNRINYAGCHALAHGLRRNQTLSELNLRNNNIGDGGLQAFAAGFAGESVDGEEQHICPIEVLDVSSNAIGDIGVRSFFTLGLVPNCTLGVLHLSRNNLTERCADALAVPLKCGNTGLTELHLDRNQLGNEACCAIASALRVNKRLTVLNICHNVVSDEGITELAAALHENTALRELHLSSNLVTDAGALHLAALLRKPHGFYEGGVLVESLHVLDLGDNKLLDKAAVAFAEALTTNKCLRLLSLRSNRISSGTCQLFADALRVNATLTELDLDLNQITMQDALRTFAPVLSGHKDANTTVEVLQVGANIAHSCRRVREKQHFPEFERQAFDQPSRKT